ncbi:hypothetical protein STSP2_00218 [Anaerohalosphaera lusitana]|uniref:Uncharacterized protein n=1 Tax=Anaerohalosphaera lusitana TaxID=1936003 RepID=A0A1U9NH47_9BACT|nr:hypothetical protein STSP2_00218 [Anaerohalosphaera lusitana]
MISAENEPFFHNSGIFVQTPFIFCRYNLQ